MRVVTIIALLTTIAGSAFAGRNFWTESRLIGAQITQIYGDPGGSATAYASTPIGYYRTGSRPSTQPDSDLAPLERPLSGR